MQDNSILKKLIIFLMLIMICIGIQQSPTRADSKQEDIHQDMVMDEEETEIFNIINTVRMQSGAKALTFKPELKKDADVRAIEADDYWSHTRPDGTAWWQLDPANMYSECLEEAHHESEEEIVQAWMKSPTHYAQITRQDLTAGAIAVYVNSEGVKYIAFEGGYLK